MNNILVVIPHLNNLYYLTKCMECIMSQSYVDFDVLFVDNGSNDGSIDYILDMSNKNSNFHHIFLSENLGFAAAVNLGFEYSFEHNFKYTILLNNDAFVHKDFINNLYNDIIKDEGLFAVNSLMLSYRDRDLIDDFGDYYTCIGYAFQNKTGQNKSIIKHDEYAFSACGGASIYNNDILKKIGVLDNKFFAYLEDIDLSYRAKLYGYKIKTSMYSICYHLGSENEWFKI